MRTFVKVAETGSFSRAARLLEASQPTVSKRVAALEAQLGFQLLHRGSRKIACTDLGNDYYRRCVQIIADVERANALGGRPEETAGTLKVNSGIAFGQIFVAPLLPKFLTLYPNVDLELSMTERHIDLVAEGADMVIRSGLLRDSTLVARKIGVTHHVVVATPSYYRACGVPEHPTDLEGHNCLLYTLAAAGLRWHFADGDKKISVRVSGNLRTASAAALYEMALAGHGIALLPHWLVQAEIDSGRLQAALVKYPAPSLPISAVYPATAFVPASLRCWIDFLAREVGNNPLFAA